MWHYVLFHAVYLALGSGNITTNNTDILITAIGENAGGGGLPFLTCHSDLTTCCRNVSDNNGNGALGQWTYPDGSVIMGNGAVAGQQFYIVRNAARVIRLARRQTNNPLTPTGSYCCTIPTTLGDITICANLGEWIKLLSLPVLYQPVYMYDFMCSPQEFMKPSQLSYSIA